jgi:hypothetical protein
MAEICEQEMFGINEAYEDEVWKAGDGALLNQQVWHGGSMVSINCVFHQIIGLVKTAISDSNNIFTAQRPYVSRAYSFYP